ncbi:16S rRNA (cytidine(1402)-2'-O)-methyltransferase [Mycoplasmopsis synoviae]|uniref:16S rRNA (cytidine(1402)-2'-O)-methyltransferase n=1 Tax=Mycoplasmopsis synoviae TaxID=2109 RepID=UPI000CA092B4|nr:16S rRNA (cytidine(1402)-2'-O)-methyltransferase [Mycoplasmopsis synoviae]AKJ20976.1 rRNA small subunit methyltransferase I [Mycoplasmopsis synoviae]AQU48311.1 rRNA small subunit methyltransferase I [Mycoplasmopsis synoviae]AWL83890.1 16S rRNA (cytidine(1402)-2'-O)-methyltransferase [Mycoplasmopsis synoviae]QLE13620.1 16S rRNA (cytidine(1402)-2'-O)-methyltransferase [Mycoplasmopsis synoviae]UZF64374.1 16S rRNA (cytidine(1402)-2'-O)-methyltransferase [Mycoplasmopsis synoviae]
MSKLYLIGTPIGNLEDITLRALNKLKEVSIIACEDTRVTYKLLKHYQIEDKKLFSHNKFNEKSSAKGLVDLILQGNDIALVSDAGMPLISDPGFDLIKLCKENNIQIELIPGVSAVTSAFVLSNFSDTFTFCGFIKDKTNQRVNYLKNLTQGTYIFFVSPHKIEKTLEDINLVFNGNEKISLSRELTKKFEKTYHGSAIEVLNTLKTNSEILGEFTLVLHIPKVKKVKISKY